MTRARRPDAEADEVDLSGAARAVVRDPGDPRMDAHLSALGLGDAPATGRRGRADALEAEAEALRGRLAAVEVELQAAHQRIRTLLGVLAAAGLAIVVLLILLAVR